MKYLKLAIIVFIVSLFAQACQKDGINLLDEAYSAEEIALLSDDLTLPGVPHSYSIGNQDSSTELDFIGTLGRVLFYDTQLSADGSTSCASCHQQSLAFSDDKAFSKGPNGNVTKRNSIALGSLRSFGAHYNEEEGKQAPGLFWDERAQTIKEQLRMTINNPNEMGMSLDDIASRVNDDAHYAILNSKAFGTSQLNEDHILEALEVFIKSINSKNTTLESDLLGDINYISGDLIVGESKLARGFELFKNNCNSCHGQNLSLSLLDLEDSEKISTANNGLLLEENDKGMYEHTQSQEDIGKFKIPGLRNIALTAPYMHDGRFSTLEEVVNFYNSGINFNPNLHPSLTENGVAKKMNLSETDKEHLIDFLTALTDDTLVSEEKWSNPFK